MYRKNYPYYHPISSGGYMTLRSVLSKLITHGSTVLDIGCGIGTIGDFLKKEKSCYVCGIDINVEAISVARKKIDQAIAIDIIGEEIPYELCFDFVLLIDLIEHLPDPALVFKKLDKVMDQNTYIIISTPNVAYFIIRASLLFGNWNYKDSGILDRTHLRFFTHRTLSEFVTKLGYEIKSTHFTHGFQTHSLYKFKSIRFLSDKITWLLPALFARQFIMVLKKRIS